jgi:ABC-2 type transport system permease protein
MMLTKVPALSSQLAGLNGNQMWVVLMTGYVLSPMFLILPLMFSTIIGAESFVGEKERKTLEALLYTPATDGELFTGKLLAAVIPAIGIAWLSFLIYTVIVNVASWPIMGRVWFPLPAWWPLMLWLTPAIATLGMAVTVLISSRVKTFMEAYQISASLVILVLVLLAGQITGVLYLSTGVTLLVGLAVWSLDAVCIWFSIRNFSRTSLLTQI